MAKAVYKISSEFPSDERFGLKSQINRSAVSIPSNIAEGSGRNSSKEFIRFLNIALSSSYELETQLLLASDLFEINIQVSLSELNELQKMIGGFKRSIEES